MKKKIFIILFISLLFCYALAKDIFVLGSEDDKMGLFSPRQVKEGPDGNIYVYDARDAYIKVYSPTGEYLRKIGGKGEGPGEIKRSDGLCFGFTGKKKLFFSEFFGGHRWITILDLNGSLNRTITLQVEQKMFGVGKAVSLPDGGFLVELGFWGSPEKCKNYFLHRTPLTLYRFDAGGKIVSKIKTSNIFTRISYLKRGGDLMIPFAPIFRWCKYKGDTIIFTNGMDKNLKVLNSCGKLINGIETSLPKAKNITKKDLEAWRKMVKDSYNKGQRETAWYKNLGKVIENYKVPIYDKKPCWEDLSITAKGNILVTGYWDPVKNKKNIWLIDEKGKTICMVKLDVNSIKMTENFVFFKKTDSESNEQTFILKREGSEESDLRELENLSPHAWAGI